MPTNEVTFTYRNWRGETRERTVTPINIEYGVYPHHDGPQWFLNATDSERGVRRSFAIEDILSPIRHVVPVVNQPHNQPLPATQVAGAAKEWF